MKTFENTKQRRPHHKIREYVTESEALISWGEEFLDRAHNLAHNIEEHVRQILNGQANTFCPDPLNSCDPQGD